MILPKDHIFFTASQCITELCKPLGSFIGIKYFDWIRTYLDGTRIRLSNYPEWVDHYFRQDYFRYTQLERSPLLYHSGFTIWDYHKGYTPDPVFKIHQDMRENFNRAHGLSILKVYPDYMDNFTFTTLPKHEEINSLYLRNLVSLEKFTSFFLRKADNLVIEAEKNKVLLPLPEKVFLSSDESSLLKTNAVEEFYQAIEEENIPSNKKHLAFLFSKRERECLKFLARGYTAKETAKELHISSKTVEFHIANAKIKSKTKTRSQLIDFYL